MLSDQGFSQLPPLDALSKVDLRGTPVTDAALAHLDAFPNLQEIFLAGTEITDEGLLTLARLPELSRVDVCMTAVTKSGVERLLAARPEVDVWYGACDQDLGRWLMICGHPTELYLGMAPCRRNPTVPVRRLHLRGTKPIAGSGAALSVTDAALAVLVDLDELEDLDLRDTDITDRGLPSLATLAALRRLDLRGTRLTEQAIVELSGLLPTCRIIGPAAAQSGSLLTKSSSPIKSGAPEAGIASAASSSCRIGEPH